MGSKYQILDVVAYASPEHLPAWWRATDPRGGCRARPGTCPARAGCTLRASTATAATATAAQSARWISRRKRSLVGRGTWGRSLQGEGQRSGDLVGGDSKQGNWRAAALQAGGQ